MDCLRFTASARLAAWDSIAENEPEFAEKLASHLRRHGHATLEASVPLNGGCGPGVAALAAILDKLVIRGHPTLADFELESGLLHWAKEKLIGFTKPETALSIEHRLTAKMFPEPWISLVQASEEVGLLPSAPTTSASDSVVLGGDGSVIEQATAQLVEQLRQRLGAGPEHVWTNVRVEDLAGDANRDPGTALARQQSVSVAVERGALRWAIRIGTPAAEDSLADKLLKDAGWSVHWLRREMICDGASNWWEDRLREWRAEPTPKWNSRADALAASKVHLAAYVLIVVPQAVHRCLRGLIGLLGNGLIEPGRPQRVLVIEEDVPAAIEAFRQLHALWSNLHALAPTSPPPPEFQIDLIGESFGLKLPETIRARKVEKPEGPYDLVLSNSFRMATGWTSAMEQAAELAPEAKRVRLRRAAGMRDERALRAAGSLRYELSDVEAATASEPMPSEGPIALKLSGLRYFLRQIFRKRDFWDGQVRVISRLLERKHTIVLLPTGGGKSLTYQFSGLLLPGMTLVVDPLVALMNDQLENLSGFSIDMIGSISSQDEDADRKRNLEELAAGRLMFMFVAPERLQIRSFREQLQSAVARCPVSLVTIDEAHCVSEWGHDFRPSYLHMPLNVQRLCTGADGQPPTLVGLTGTASFAVLTDVQAELGITDERAVVAPKSFDRKELVFDVRKVRRLEKPQALRAVRQALPQMFGENPQTFFRLQGSRTNGGIIFCPHVNGTLGVTEVSRVVGHRAIFAGEMPKGFAVDRFAWNHHKLAVQRGFKHNRIQELVATKSFGMGIDKPNIRYTIHYAMPQSVEGFYQEAGRAGRNGQPGYARCIILYSDDNWSTALDVLNERNHAQATTRLDQVAWDYRGDLMVQLWLLLNSYKGREQEKENAIRMWRYLHPRVASLPVGGVNRADVSFGWLGTREATEKAIFRLMLLGAVEDYTVNWTIQTFEVGVVHADETAIRRSLAAYIGKYKFPQQVEALLARVPRGTLEVIVSGAVDVLVDFIYDEIVAKRKQALRTMGELCRNFRSDQEFREAILAYLQESEFTEPLKGWLRRPFRAVGLERIKATVAAVGTLDQLKRLIGTVRRLLDEEPDNLALRVLSVCARAAAPSETDESVAEEAGILLNALDHAQEVSGKERGALQAFVFEHLGQHRPEAGALMALRRLAQTGSCALARALLETVLGTHPAVREAAVKLIAGHVLKPVLKCGFWRGGAEEDNETEAA